MRGGDLSPHSLIFQWAEVNKWQREAVSRFMLPLLQHMPWSDNKDTILAPTSHQFRENYAVLEALPKTRRTGKK